MGKGVTNPFGGAASSSTDSTSEEEPVVCDSNSASCLELVLLFGLSFAFILLRWTFSRRKTLMKYRFSGLDIAYKTVLPADIPEISDNIGASADFRTANLLTYTDSNNHCTPRPRRSTLAAENCDAVLSFNQVLVENNQPVKTELEIDTPTAMDIPKDSLSLPESQSDSFFTWDSGGSSGEYSFVHTAVELPKYPDDDITEEDRQMLLLYMQSGHPELLLSSNTMNQSTTIITTSDNIPCEPVAVRGFLETIVEENSDDLRSPSECDETSLGWGSWDESDDDRVTVVEMETSGCVGDNSPASPNLSFVERNVTNTNHRANLLLKSSASKAPLPVAALDNIFENNHVKKFSIQNPLIVREMYSGSLFRERNNDNSSEGQRKGSSDTLSEDNTFVTANSDIICAASKMDTIYNEKDGNCNSGVSPLNSLSIKKNDFDALWISVNKLESPSDTAIPWNISNNCNIGLSNEAKNSIPEIQEQLICGENSLVVLGSEDDLCLVPSNFTQNLPEHNFESLMFNDDFKDYFLPTKDSIFNREEMNNDKVLITENVSVCSPDKNMRCFRIGFDDEKLIENNQNSDAKIFDSPESNISSSDSEAESMFSPLNGDIVYGSSWLSDRDHKPENVASGTETNSSTIDVLPPTQSESPPPNNHRKLVSQFEQCASDDDIQDVPSSLSRWQHHTDLQHVQEATSPLTRWQHQTNLQMLCNGEGEELKCKQTNSDDSDDGLPSHIKSLYNSFKMKGKNSRIRIKDDKLNDFKALGLWDCETKVTLPPFTNSTFEKRSSPSHTELNNVKEELDDLELDMFTVNKNNTTLVSNDDSDIDDALRSFNHLNEYSTNSDEQSESESELRINFKEKNSNEKLSPDVTESKDRETINKFNISSPVIVSEAESHSLENPCSDNSDNCPLCREANFKKSEMKDLFTEHASHEHVESLLLNTYPKMTRLSEDNLTDVETKSNFSGNSSKDLTSPLTSSDSDEGIRGIKEVKKRIKKRYKDNQSSELKHDDSGYVEDDEDDDDDSMEEKKGTDSVSTLISKSTENLDSANKLRKSLSAAFYESKSNQPTCSQDNSFIFTASPTFQEISKQLEEWMKNEEFKSEILHGNKWKIPENLSQFSASLLDKELMKICGGEEMEKMVTSDVISLREHTIAQFLKNSTSNEQIMPDLLQVPPLASNLHPNLDFLCIQNQNDELKQVNEIQFRECNKIKIENTLIETDNSEIKLDGEIKIDNAEIKLGKGIITANSEIMRIKENICENSNTNIKTNDLKENRDDFKMFVDLKVVENTKYPEINTPSEKFEENSKSVFVDKEQIVNNKAQLINSIHFAEDNASILKNNYNSSLSNDNDINSVYSSDSTSDCFVSKPQTTSHEFFTESTTIPELCSFEKNHKVVATTELRNMNEFEREVSTTNSPGETNCQTMNENRNNLHSHQSCVSVKVVAPPMEKWEILSHTETGSESLDPMTCGEEKGASEGWDEAVEGVSSPPAATLVKSEVGEGTHVPLLVSSHVNNEDISAPYLAVNVKTPDSNICVVNEVFGNFICDASHGEGDSDVFSDSGEVNTEKEVQGLTVISQDLLFEDCAESLLSSCADKFIGNEITLSDVVPSSQQSDNSDERESEILDIALSSSCETDKGDSILPNENTSPVEKHLIELLDAETFPSKTIHNSAISTDNKSRIIIDEPKSENLATNTVKAEYKRSSSVGHDSEQKLDSSTVQSKSTPDLRNCHDPLNSSAPLSARLSKSVCQRIQDYLGHSSRGGLLNRSLPPNERSRHYRRICVSTETVVERAARFEARSRSISGTRKNSGDSWQFSSRSGSCPVSNMRNFDNNARAYNKPTATVKPTIGSRAFNTLQENELNGKSRPEKEDILELITGYSKASKVTHKPPVPPINPNSHQMLKAARLKGKIATARKDFFERLSQQDLSSAKEENKLENQDDLYNDSHGLQRFDAFRRSAREERARLAASHPDLGALEAAVRSSKRKIDQLKRKKKSGSQASPAPLDAGPPQQSSMPSTMKEGTLCLPYRRCTGEIAWASCAKRLEEAKAKSKPNLAQEQLEIVDRSSFWFKRPAETKGVRAHRPGTDDDYYEEDPASSNGDGDSAIAGAIVVENCDFLGTRAKSMDFLLDADNRDKVQPPENRLAAGQGRVKSEHELRIERSLQNLTIPDWYKQSAWSKKPTEGFILRRGSEGSTGESRKRWQGFSTSRTPSATSLTTPPNTYSHRNIIVPKRVTPTSNEWRYVGSLVSSRESLTPASPSSLSPRECASAAFQYGLSSSLSRWSSSRLSTSSAPLTTLSVHRSFRQPYLGWRAAAASSGYTASSGGGSRSSPGVSPINATTPVQGSRPTSPRRGSQEHFGYGLHQNQITSAATLRPDGSDANDTSNRISPLALNTTNVFFNSNVEIPNSDTHPYKQRYGSAEMRRDRYSYTQSLYSGTVIMSPGTIDDDRRNFNVDQVPRIIASLEEATDSSDQRFSLVKSPQPPPRLWMESSFVGTKQDGSEPQLTTTRSIRIVPSDSARPGTGTSARSSTSSLRGGTCATQTAMGSHPVSSHLNRDQRPNLIDYESEPKVYPRGSWRHSSSSSKDISPDNSSTDNEMWLSVGEDMTHKSFRRTPEHTDGRSSSRSSISPPSPTSSYPTEQKRVSVDSTGSSRPIFFASSRRGSKGSNQDGKQETSPYHQSSNMADYSQKQLPTKEFSRKSSSTHSEESGFIRRDSKSGGSSSWRDSKTDQESSSATTSRGEKDSKSSASMEEVLESLLAIPPISSRSSSPTSPRRSKGYGFQQESHPRPQLHGARELQHSIPSVHPQLDQRDTDVLSRSKSTSSRTNIPQGGDPNWAANECRGLENVADDLGKMVDDSFKFPPLFPSSSTTATQLLPISSPMDEVNHGSFCHSSSTSPLEDDVQSPTSMEVLVPEGEEQELFSIIEGRGPSINTTTTTEDKGTTREASGTTPTKKRKPVRGITGTITTTEGHLKCHRPKCTKSLPVEEARAKFRTCPNCYTYYCSRQCRKLHLTRHKEHCPQTRISNLCKQVLMKARDDPVSRRHLSLCAKRGLLSRGRGAVKLLFLNPEDALDYLVHGWESAKGQTLYVSRSDLLPQEMGSDVFSQVRNFCDKYNPERKFILLAAITVTSEIAAALEREVVVRGAKMHLSPSLPEDDVQTLILTITKTDPETGDPAQTTVEDRKNGLSVVEEQLSARGVDLEKLYPHTYRKILKFVNENEPFTPISIFPTDQRNGRVFMCIILPWADADIIVNISTKGGAGIGKSSKRKWPL